MTQPNLPPAAAALVAPGGPYEMQDALIDGVRMRVFLKAPACLGEVYRQATDNDPADCYVYEDERHTFSDAAALADQVAANLQAIGVKSGDRVGISMRNYPEWIWIFMGVTRMGAVAVCMNAWWTGEEMAYAIEDSGLATLFVDRERLEHISPYLDELDLNVIAVRSVHTGGRGVRSWADFLATTTGAPTETNVLPDDYATILYTSGSTAHPKGAVSTHRAIIHALLGWEAAAEIVAAASGKDRPPEPYPPAMILTVPLFHVTGLNVQLLSSFRKGRKLVGMYKWDPDKALAIIENERITEFNGVPTMAYEMVRSPNYDDYDLSSLKSMGGGGAAMAPQQSRQIRERSGGRIAPGAGYGMTETNGLATAIGGRDLAARPKSCGRPLPPLVDIQVVDEQGSVLSAGQTGEIWIRGAMNFSGYWNQPAATAETLSDGWVHTGDIGCTDEEGFVYITDRLKDMVIRGGENIGCQEVEAVVLEHPQVVECVVFGVPDPRLGESLAATVQQAPGSGLTAGDVRSFVGEHLARFKVPEHVWIQEAQLPRIASGKLYKRGIRENAIKLLSGEEEGER